VPALPPFSAFAIPLATLFILPNRPISECLGDVFDAINQQTDQDDFQAGLCHAFLRLRLDQERDLEIALELLLLAGRIKAFGLIGLVSQRIAEIGYGERAQTFFATAFNLVRRLAEDRRHEAEQSDAANFIKHLEYIRGPLAPDLARLALVALSAAEPSRLHSHLRRFYIPLEHQFGLARERRATPEQKMGLQAARRRLILDVAAVVPDSMLLRESADNGRFRPDGGTSTRFVLDWWSFTLLCDLSDRMIRLREHLGLPQPPSISLAAETPDPCDGEDAPDPQIDGASDKWRPLHSSETAVDAQVDEDYAVIAKYIPVRDTDTTLEERDG
jgi:hypothetical protein